MSTIPSAIPDFDTYFAKADVGRTVVRIKKNDIIYSQGDPAESIFYIKNGRIRLNVTSEHGKEAVVAIMEAGQFFGEGCLNGHTARVATAVSVANGEITSITKSGMRELLKGTSKNSSPS